MDKTLLLDIAKVLGIDEKELNFRKDFITITQEDITVLGNFYNTNPRMFDKLAENFYKHLLSFEGTKEKLSPDQLPELKIRLKEYLRQMFNGKYDYEYFLNRLFMGYVHKEAGIELEQYIGAYGNLISDMENIIGKLTHKNRESFPKIMSAIFKIILLDIISGTDVYSYEYLADSRRLSKLYAVLSNINRFIIRVHDINELFQEVCPILINSGGFKFAWIGIVDGETKEIKPVSMWGDGEAFLQNIKLSTNKDIPEGNGPTGTAIRESKIVVSNDIEHDAKMLPWMKSAFSVGFRSSASAPLYMDDKAIGALNIYADKPFQFGKEETKLFEEITSDISFAINNIGKMQKIKYISLFDPLTDLPNREHVLQELNRFIESGGKNKKVSLILFDIDKFKFINESLGYTKGDELLKEISKRLITITDPQTLLGRIGADEFAIVCFDMKSEEKLFRVIEKTENTFLNPVTINEKDFNITFCKGISIYPNDGKDAEELIKIAEASLVRAKKLGPNSVTTYSPEINQKLSYILKMKKKLIDAVEKREFIQYYQPKIDLKTLKISGAEALLRWNDQENGMVLSTEFIPLLEETGLILNISKLSFEEVLNQQKRWVKQGYHIPVAINASAVQLDRDDFPEQIINAMNNAGVDPDIIELEITESIIMKDIDIAIKKLKTLKDYGIKIAIDDFGTGYSSLAYLKKLPINSLKIDISFVRDVVDNKESNQIIKAILSLANILNLKTIAEGVETRKQIELLKTLGCDEAQGFYFSKPLPAAAFEKFIIGFSK